MSGQEAVPLGLYPRPHVPLLAPLHVPGVAALGELEVRVHGGRAPDLPGGDQARSVPLVLSLRPRTADWSDVNILRRLPRRRRPALRRSVTVARALLGRRHWAAHTSVALVGHLLP